MNMDKIIMQAVSVAGTATANAVRKPSSATQPSESTMVEFDDGRSYDPVAVHQSTQRWIDLHMKRRETEFTESAPMKMFCGTWNVNGKALKEGNLADWLYPSGTQYTDGNSRPLSDVYIIGFQEAVDLNAVNVAMDTETRKRCSFWQDSIGDCLNNSGVSYRHIANKYLVGLIVFVYVREAIADSVRDVRTTSTGVGVMGMLGNKGGACIRFTLFDSAVCVVCAHLAAHRENVAGRNADYANILDKSVFLPVDPSSPSSDGQNADGTMQGNVPSGNNKKKEFQYKAGMSELSELKVTDHDVVFWVGDLNYRIDESVPMEEVFQRIENNDMDLLREMDQLNIERARGNCFQDFSEGRLNFAPTYKYQPGTDDYDRRPEKKIRAPAWCDRILWRINKGSAETVDQLCYTRAELKPSDHKPVSALFDCSLRRIISEKQTAVFEDLLRELDKWENDSIPRVELSADQIDLGVLHFMEKYHTSVKLRNVGTSIAHWHLVAKLEEKRVSKRFITYTPQLGMLLPGEEVEISVTATIDVVTARLLNKGTEALDDITVLRIENGRDFYFNVTGQFARSCYGMSLEQLVCTWDPVRFTKLPGDDSTHVPSEEAATIAAMHAVSAASGISPDGTKEMSVPKELWRLVDALWVGGHATERDLFTVGADPAEAAAVRECLDRGEEFPPRVSPHALVDALTCFISSLAAPLLPPELYPSAAQVEPQNIRMFARRFLEQLPPLNYNVFVYLISFERELLKHEEDNSLNAQRMAAISIGFMTRLGPLAIASPTTSDSPTSPPTAPGAPAPAPGQPTSPPPVPNAAEIAAAQATSAANATQLALQSLLVYFLTSQSL